MQLREKLRSSPLPIYNTLRDDATYFSKDVGSPVRDLLGDDEGVVGSRRVGRRLRFVSFFPVGDKSVVLKDIVPGCVLSRRTEKTLKVGVGVEDCSPSTTVIVGVGGRVGDGSVVGDVFALWIVLDNVGQDVSNASWRLNVGVTVVDVEAGGVSESLFGGESSDSVKMKVPVVVSLPDDS